MSFHLFHFAANSCRDGARTVPLALFLMIRLPLESHDDHRKKAAMLKDECGEGEFKFHGVFGSELRTIPFRTVTDEIKRAAVSRLACTPLVRLLSFVHWDADRVQHIPAFALAVIRAWDSLQHDQPVHSANRPP